MKIKDKRLKEELEKISKEVESWPAWKRSIDLNNPAKGLPYTKRGQK